MSITFTVDGKVVGQKRPIFSDWHIELPPMDGGNGDPLKLRDLISSIVVKEVEAFKTRQDERKLARVMSRQAIDRKSTRLNSSHGYQSRMPSSA